MGKAGTRGMTSWIIDLIDIYLRWWQLVSAGCRQAARWQIPGGVARMQALVLQAKRASILDEGPVWMVAGGAPWGGHSGGQSSAGAELSMTGDGVGVVIGGWIVG